MKVTAEGQEPWILALDLLAFDFGSYIAKIITDPG
jgi:hypothetical protein